MEDFARQMRDLGRKQAERMRDQARSVAHKRKEEYLGARVPKELREKVLARADELGVPVSILIRDILIRAFADEQSPVKVDRAMGGGKPAADRDFANVIAWERIVLNRSLPCGGCGRDIAAGSVATLALAAPGEDRVILCGKCREPV